MKKNILIVGAGFSGAVLAERFAKKIDCSITIIDERNHIGGNCHTERDSSTGIMEHIYGPHIFNTNRKDVWNYVNKFCEMVPFINRVKSVVNNSIYSMPINLHTINQFFNKSLSPREAIDFIAELGDKRIVKAQNFEEQAIKMLGHELYYAFFYGYTKKQWGCEPKELAASILTRLPVRFNYDDNYYNSEFQGIPREGYTNLIGNLINNKNIFLELNTAFKKEMMQKFDYVFYTGPIDRFFDYKFGNLSYRTVLFEKHEDVNDFQGNAVINYPEMNKPYTRIHEHKHFTPWEKFDKTIYIIEYSKETENGDIPYYPKRLAKDLQIFEQYKIEAYKTEKISFVGRLATYRYLNMDQCIAEAIDFSKKSITLINNNKNAPKFSIL